MDISKYKIKIKHHAYIRAIERGIDPDQIEYLLKNGKTIKIGKHGIKFVNKSKKRNVVCVGEIISNEIRIFTIEVKNDNM